MQLVNPFYYFTLILQSLDVQHNLSLNTINIIMHNVEVQNFTDFDSIQSRNILLYFTVYSTNFRPTVLKKKQILVKITNKPTHGLLCCFIFNLLQGPLFAII
jgi:hypothetical protein